MGIGGIAGRVDGVWQRGSLLVRVIARVLLERDRRVDDRDALIARLVGELGRALEHSGGGHRLLDGVVELAAFRREFVLVLDEEQRSLRGVDGAAALRLRGREDAVGGDDGVRGPERGAARACVVVAAIRVDVVAPATAVA